jgi:hypothetical protein
MAAESCNFAAVDPVPTRPAACWIEEPEADFFPHAYTTHHEERYFPKSFLRIPPSSLDTCCNGKRE